MKNMVLAAAILASTSVLADNLHNGYIRKDGTYVAPHYQSGPDRNPYNNYSSQGNSNPYTGQQGTRDPYKVQQEYAPPRGNNEGQYQRPYRPSY